MWHNIKINIHNICKENLRPSILSICSNSFQIFYKSHHNYCFNKCQPGLTQYDIMRNWTFSVKLLSNQAYLNFFNQLAVCPIDVFTFYYHFRATRTPQGHQGNLSNVCRNEYKNSLKLACMVRGRSPAFLTITLTLTLACVLSGSVVWRRTREEEEAAARVHGNNLEEEMARNLILRLHGLGDSGPNNVPIKNFFFAPEFVNTKWLFPSAPAQRVTC